MTLHLVTIFKLANQNKFLDLAIASSYESLTIAINMFKSTTMITKTNWRVRWEEGCEQKRGKKSEKGGPTTARRARVLAELEVNKAGVRCCSCDVSTGFFPETR